MKELATLARNLKTLRGRRGLTQAELGKLAGLEPSAVSHFEVGRRAPSCASLIRIADALDASIDDLFGRRKNSQNGA
jgi:transcriptional regulator with XRE-family HTH domain